MVSAGGSVLRFVRGPPSAWHLVRGPMLTGACGVLLGVSWIFHFPFSVAHCVKQECALLGMLALGSWSTCCCAVRLTATETPVPVADCALPLGIGTCAGLWLKLSAQSV